MVASLAKFAVARTTPWVDSLQDGPNPGRESTQRTDVVATFVCDLEYREVFNFRTPPREVTAASPGSLTSVADLSIPSGESNARSLIASNMG